MDDVKPIILKKVGSKWEVYLDVAAAKAYGSKSKKLKDYPPDAVLALVRTGPKSEPGSLSLELEGKPAKFTKDEARGIAHRLGRYMLGFGDLVYAYTDEV